MSQCPAPANEADWVERARRGDAEAFARLYEAYQSSAFGAAILLTNDRTLAADVVQEAFIKAFLAMPRFRSGQPFRPWFFRILTNEALRSLKRKRLWERFRPAPREQPAPVPTPEALALDRERAEEVWKAVSELPEIGRAAVVLRYYLGLSEEEMTSVLGVPAGTVKSRVARARERLKHILANV
ncbi:RNA polymerase sigma-70 factor (ECF subfamily) [Symbiobacterium terraclitae]|uniref:RNA polymerase sigma-70 factor (ECF subfamily) n=1 Tax=Symbiobacterium terraclitae TaxID=557451 RepID=A0ABS4JWZ3_9FIRM|nr:sigma-70 family RNA polymerase sigma factor [Symbiobacterium terraclitae]MBP2020050.1 RNA polymerase sigma-70 factor (ECF subfamily) [Symbiobacterium terraclitae]